MSIEYFVESIRRNPVSTKWRFDEMTLRQKAFSTKWLSRRSVVRRSVVYPIFWYDNIGIWLGKPSPGQKRICRIYANFTFLNLPTRVAQSFQNAQFSTQKCTVWLFSSEVCALHHYCVHKCRMAQFAKSAFLQVKVVIWGKYKNLNKITKI